MSLINAYTAGCKAAAGAQPQSANPFHWSDERAAAWDLGWNNYTSARMNHEGAHRPEAAAA